MDSRWIVGALTIALPTALIGVTVYQFSSNPLSLLALLAVMIVGGIYLLSYPESA
jgi:hypothetical protein